MKRFVSLYFLFILFFLLPSLFLKFSWGFWPKGKEEIVAMDIPSLSQRWTSVYKSEEDNLRALLNLLKRSNLGRKLIEQASAKARDHGETLFDLIKVSDSSLTDTTLLRRFSSSEPTTVAYEMYSKIYINKELTVLDAVLDLGHELTHYIYRTPFNPYSAEFSLKDFIASTIEGKGGEVDAYMMECRVLNSLFPDKARNRVYCEAIKDSKTGDFSRELTIKQFYKIGPNYAKFIETLNSYGLDKKDVSYVSDEAIAFVSSVYKEPYPMAAIKEYKQVMSRACRNDLKRLSYIQGRTPASYSDYKEKFERRCSQFVF